MPNHFTLTFFLLRRRDVSCSHSNRDLFTCEDNMLFSHVKICFRAKAHLVFHWYLFYKTTYPILHFLKIMHDKDINPLTPQPPETARVRQPPNFLNRPRPPVQNGGWFRSSLPPPGVFFSILLSWRLKGIINQSNALFCAFFDRS